MRTFVLMLMFISFSSAASDKNSCSDAAAIACKAATNGNSVHCEQRMVQACERITKIDAHNDPAYQALIEITRSYCGKSFDLSDPNVEIFDYQNCLTNFYNKYAPIFLL
jgi:hypothetical protein